jgi:glycosyltransferase involved in cell wall biosynthesis
MKEVIEASERAGARLLAVSWAMPPLLLPRALQVPRTLGALARMGWQVTVVHAGYGLVPPDAPREVSLGEPAGNRYRSLAVALPRPAGWKPLFAALARCGLDETAWRWLALRKAAGLLEQARFDALLTFAQPWSDHLVGLRVRQRLGIPWVAHFSDPWVDNPLLHAKDEKRLPRWRQQEEQVVREASAVVFTNDYTLELVMRKYPASWRQKAFVVPHGYDRAVLQSLPLRERGERMRLAMTGNFYAARTPEPLLEALGQLARRVPLRGQLEVLIAGANNERFEPLAAQMGLDGVVRFFRTVPYRESLELLNSADVLLLIDAPSGEASPFLPSKLIDYLMFAKPILGITPVRGASAELLRRLDCPVAAPGDVAGIARAVEELLERWRAGRLAVSEGFRAVAEQYEIRRVTERLDAILREAARLGSSAVSGS